MYKLYYIALATNIQYDETFSSVAAAVEREEQLMEFVHWAGGQRYGFFHLARL